MGQKLVSFKVAKAIKEVGYPQSIYCPQYKENGELENGFTDLGEGYIYAPTYLDVWLWLWSKNIRIELCTSAENEDLTACYIRGKATEQDFASPEEAIIYAIDFLIDNDFVK